MQPRGQVGEFAGKEFGLETALDKMEAEWRGMDLTVKPYKDTGTCVMVVVMLNVLLFACYWNRILFCCGHTSLGIRFLCGVF